MIRRINLYGAPGSGKSTYAAYLYSILKRRGFNIELITEAIKPWAYQKKVPQGFDQLHLFTKQLRREEKYLSNGVDLIITDSPLYLNCTYACYNKTLGHRYLANLAWEFEILYPSLHFLCVRNFNYNPKGRFETSDQADKFNLYLRDRLGWWLYGKEVVEVDPASFDVTWLINLLRSSSPSSTSILETSTEPASSCCVGSSPSTTSDSSCKNTKDSIAVTASS